MAHIAIQRELMGHASGNLLIVQGIAIVSTDEALELDWEATVSWSALTAAGINAAIKTAAVAAAAAQGHTVGPFDNKILFNGAIGL